MNPKFIVERIHPDAKLPVYSTTKAADCDLFTVESTYVPASSWALVKTGLKMSIPHGWRIKLESRSGLALNHGIEIGAGVIDEDYRGEIGILVFNHSKVSFKIESGDKICQASIERYVQADFEEGHVEDRDAESNRIGGFGSTDKPQLTLKGILKNPNGTVMSTEDQQVIYDKINNQKGDLFPHE